MQDCAGRRKSPANPLKNWVTLSIYQAAGSTKPPPKSSHSLPSGATMKFTAKAVAAFALPAGKAERIVFDEHIGGFGLRLRAGGSKIWIFQYKLGAKQRRLSFGSYPSMGLDQARRTASDLQAQVRLGRDPSADKSEARAQSATTFKAVAQKYLDRQKSELRPRSYREIVRHLNVNARPLHSEPLAKIDRRRIAELISGLPSNKFHVHATLNAFFSWAMREGLVDANPVMATNKPPKPMSRERTLSEGELRDVWRALQSDDYGDILRLLILTGARRDEIGSLAWSEVNLDNALISLPSERTKNKRPFDLPLSAPALSVLKAREKLDHREFVFGRGESGFSGWSACKRRLDARIAELRESEGKPAMQPWALHDLRRSFSTTAHDKLKIQPHIVEATLNHISVHKSGVAGTYNRALYREEKRAALATWGDFVMSMVEARESNVVPLRA
jgi:integrase